MKYILAFLFFLFLCVMALNYSGFCYHKLSWMSDQDYIYRAVEERVSNRDLRHLYKSADEFLEKHPKCCTVYRFSGFMKDNWILAPLFLYRVIVSVSYPLEINGIKENYSAHILVTVCGKPSFERGIGTPIYQSETQ